MAAEVQRLAKPFGVGLVMIAIVVATVLYMRRGAHIAPQGKILKVRTSALDENSSVAVVDFRMENASDVGLIVREVTVTLQAADGKTYTGSVAAETDAQNLFKYYPLLGQKFNDTLRIRDKVPARQTIDRMIAARFEVADSQLAGRKQLTVRVEDVDGPVAEIQEK